MVNQRSLPSHFWLQNNKHKRPFLQGENFYTRQAILLDRQKAHHHNILVQKEK